MSVSPVLPLPTTLLMPEKPPAPPAKMLVAARVERLTLVGPALPAYVSVLPVPPASVLDCEPVVTSKVPLPASERFSNDEYVTVPLVPLSAPLMVQVAAELLSVSLVLLLPTTLLMPLKPPAAPPLMLVAAPVARSTLTGPALPAYVSVLPVPPVTVPESEPVIMLNVPPPASARLPMPKKLPVSKLCVPEFAPVTVAVCALALIVPVPVSETFSKDVQLVGPLLPASSAVRL